MDTCEDADRPQYVPIRYRDGLIIALLIACPIRIKNLTGLVIGQHLVFDGCAYRLKLTAAETKTGRPYIAAVPPELTPYIDGWLQVHRPLLQLIAAGKAQVGSIVGWSAAAVLPWSITITARPASPGDSSHGSQRSGASPHCPESALIRSARLAFISHGDVAYPAETVASEERPVSSRLIASSRRRAFASYASRRRALPAVR